MACDLRSETLAAINKARSVISDYGFRRYTVDIVTRTWTGYKVGEGTSSESVVALSPRPRVRNMSQAEIASSGGTFREGDMVLDQITPYFNDATCGTGGYTASQLRPSTNLSNVETFFRLTGDEGVIQAQLVRADFDNPVTYKLILRRTRVTP